MVVSILTIQPYPLYRFVDGIWYGEHPVGLLLAPLGWCYRLLATGRRLAYERGYISRTKLSVPVIVVGNICVGGAGKTPVVSAIAQVLKSKGYRPGIVTRGYRGRAKQWPQAVTPDSDPFMVGDEAVLLARQTECAVSAGPDRVQAAQSLVDAGCGVILSDDGLQHYRLIRDLEIAVVDGERRHGNGQCLPAGPLREPPTRLRHVDMVINNGRRVVEGEWSVQMRQALPTLISDENQQRSWQTFMGDKVHAVAGIAHPERFFADLESKGLDIVRHAFKDHHEFRAADCRFADSLPVIMTEKDAVKCRQFADSRFWYVPLVAELSRDCSAQLLKLLDEVASG